MNPIRVARIITRLNVGGPAYQATLLNHLLPRRGYETLLIHGQVPPGEVFFRELLERYPGPTVQSRRLQRPIAPLADAAAIVELTRILRDFKPDVVHTHMAKAGLVGRAAARLAGAKVIVHTYHGHVLEGYFKGPVRRMILTAERFLAGRTDRLVTISPNLAAELAGRFRIADPAKFAVIELGLPLDRFLSLPPRGVFRTRLNIPDSALVLGSLGRLAPIKNYHRMIEVFHGLVPKFPSLNLHLVIGGTGPLEPDLRAAAQTRGLGDRVHFPGVVKELPEFYADIDIAILTSDNEGTPVTLLEAQAAGKFCVAPDVGGIGDVLYPEASVLVRPNEPAAYVRALEPILNDWSAFGKAPEQIRSTVVARFSPDRLLNDIDALYRTLLHEKEGHGT